MRAQKRALVVTAALVVVGSVMIGPPADAAPKTKPARWADALCSTFLDWNTRGAADSKTLNAATPANVAELKAAIATYLNARVAEAQTAQDRMDRAGVPDVKRGGSISKGFHDFFAAAQSSLAGLLSDIQGNPTSDPTVIETQYNTAQDAQNKLLGANGKKVDALINKEPKLLFALKHNATCEVAGAF